MVSPISLRSTYITDRYGDLLLDLDDAELQEVEDDPNADKDVSDAEGHGRSAKAAADNEDEDEPAAKRHHGSSGGGSPSHVSKTRVSGTHRSTITTCIFTDLHARTIRF